MELDVRASDWVSLGLCRGAFTHRWGRLSCSVCGSAKCLRCGGCNCVPALRARKLQPQYYKRNLESAANRGYQNVGGKTE